MECLLGPDPASFLLCILNNPTRSPSSMQPLGMSLAASSTTQLRDRHDEHVFKAAARRWLSWLLAYYPLLLPDVPISSGKENWPFLTRGSCATLYALIERPRESVRVVAGELVPLKWVTPEGNIHVLVRQYESEKRGWCAAPVHPMQKGTGLSRAWTSHLPFGSWLTSSRQQLTLWLLVFSQAHYKCILIFTQNHPC